jgi:hypothetical protein
VGAIFISLPENRRSLARKNGRDCLVRFQPGDNCTETFPPILVFDLRNARLEIMRDAVDLP